MNLESTLASRRQVQLQCRVVAFLCAFESLHALGILCQTTKAEVFEADDTTILNASEIH